MTTMQTDRLVDDYLSRLEAAAAHPQRSRRAELIAEIREHIEAALREEDAAGEVAVRNVLERLGPPEEIVEAAEPAPEAEQRRSPRRYELVAVRPDQRPDDGEHESGTVDDALVPRRPQREAAQIDVHELLVVLVQAPVRDRCAT